MNNTYHASGANTEGSNDIPKDGAQNVRWGRRLQQGRFIDGTDKKGIKLTWGRTRNKLCSPNNGGTVRNLFVDKHRERELT